LEDFPPASASAVRLQQTAAIDTIAQHWLRMED